MNKSTAKKDKELVESIDNLISCYPVEETEKHFRDCFASHLKCSAGYDPEALVSMFYVFNNLIDILKERQSQTEG